MHTQGTTVTTIQKLNCEGGCYLWLNHACMSLENRKQAYPHVQCAASPQGRGWKAGWWTLRYLSLNPSDCSIHGTQNAAHWIFNATRELGAPGYVVAMSGACERAVQSAA